MDIRAVFSIPIARSNSQPRGAMPANGSPFEASLNSWPVFAGVGCGFARSLVRMAGCDPALPFVNGRCGAP